MGNSDSQEVQLPYKASEHTEIDIPSKGKKQTSYAQRTPSIDSNRQVQLNPIMLCSVAWISTGIEDKRLC